MCANALEHAQKSLEFLQKLKDPRVFHFFAKPQVLAIASLSLYYNNYNIYTEKRLNVRQGLAARLDSESTTFASVAKFYYIFSMDILDKCRKNSGMNPHDNTFFAMSAGCLNVLLFNLDYRIYQAIT
jgi:farnesyl-diphosphate farnesyltransferase